MKKTKELHTENTKKILFRICAFVFVTIIYCGISGHLRSSEAALLNIHNHVTNDTYNYSRSNIRYVINGLPIQTDFPGLILSNGAAVGPCKTLFEDALGLSCDYTDMQNTFTLRYGTQYIQMTLGNTEVIVNGVTKYMNNAPFVYSFNDSAEKYLYVPTRFVSETFGFEYHWDSASSTVSIIRPNIIYDGNEAVPYTGEHPAFSINGITFVAENYPGFIFNNTVYFSAEDYFQSTELADYAYAEGSGLIVLKNGEHTLRMVLGSPVAYINESSYLLPDVPRLITPNDSNKAKIYIPAEFVAKSLGYEVVYNRNGDYLFELSGTPLNRTDSDSSEAQDSNLTSENVIPNTESYSKVLFEEEAHEQVYKHYSEQGYDVPYSLSAFSCLNSDALYLKGVDLNNVSVTDKNDILEIVIAGYQNPFDGTMFYNPDADFLNYCYISSENLLRLLIIKTKELHYYMYSAPDGCVIHFTNTLGLYRDKLAFTINSGASDDAGSSGNNTTDIFSGTSVEDMLPDTVFTKNHFVIRLPEGVSQQMITDSDLYWEKKFTISIPGNYIAFLSEQDTYNPIKTLESVRFSYKASDNTTVITFKTTEIQGYAITVSGNYLGVQIANPPDIYDKIIVLDAGHGGIDPGTLRGSVYEKNVNFNVINTYAPEFFKDSDIKVYHTRTTDTKIALQTRADFAATVGADLFISFHVNANSSASANGTSVYYSSANNSTSASGLKSSLLAKTLVDYLSAEWNTRNRGILTEKFVVVHNNTVPAVLVECGYITNNSDFEKIKSSEYQKKAAKALYEAVVEIFDRYPTGR